MMSGYNVQCLAGHVYELPADDPLVEACKKREREGLLDALCLTPRQCRECWADHRARLQREARMCASAGCPLGEDSCKKGCEIVLELREFERRSAESPAALILADQFAPLRDRIRAARELGYRVHRKVRGRRGEKKVVGTVFWHPNTQRRFIACVP